jgi:hypothetical protein
VDNVVLFEQLTACFFFFRQQYRRRIKQSTDQASTKGPFRNLTRICWSASLFSSEGTCRVSQRFVFHKRNKSSEFNSSKPRWIKFSSNESGCVNVWFRAAQFWTIHNLFRFCEAEFCQSLQYPQATTAQRGLYYHVVVHSRTSTELNPSLLVHTHTHESFPKTQALDRVDQL